MTIHTLTALQLRDALSRRDLSSREVVDALIARRDAVDPTINALVVRFDAQARAEADAADGARARGERLGALHGLPITIKESMATAGTASTLGVPNRQGHKEPQDAVTVALLRRAGAIVLAKSNVPMLLLSHESNNPIWGRTLNPWHTGKSPGGSSGGESAAIAAGMSPWGVGTDIGGSIRVPAAFTGIVGFKPTVDRWSNLRSYTALAGQEVVRGQCGPMARTAADVAALFTAIDSPAHAALDPYAVPIATEDPGAYFTGGHGAPAVRSLQGLRVGLYVDDGFLTAAASVQRAVRRAGELLASLGVEVVPFTPPCGAELIELYYAALSSDGSDTAKALLGSDPVTPELEGLMKALRLPAPLRPALAAFLERKGEPRVARLLRQLRRKPVDAYWRITARRSAIRAEVHAAWAAAGLDAVVCPVHATPPMSHTDSADVTAAGSYAMRYNFLNFPAGVVPLSRVRADELQRPGAGDRIERKLRDIEAGSVGLPLAVQVATRPHQDGLCLALMMALDTLARQEPDFPATPIDPRGGMA